jgi:pimeloyl-ACP methyl ester carboxylesterase
MQTVLNPILASHNFQHAAAVVGDIKLHYVIGGRPVGTAPLVLLIHGFPQNWWAWHKILPALSSDFTVVVPDLRGVGLSDKPAAGYTKKQLAADLHALVQTLDCGPAHVFGHDIGGMVAYAYAWQFPLRSVAILDVSIPGVGDWDHIVASPKLWHFPFHQKRDLAEALICGGREHLYISTFISDLTHRSGAISASDLDEYAGAYSLPGAFRAAMEMYRQFPQDVLDNRAAGRLPSNLPVLALGGDKRWGEHMVSRLTAVSDNVTGGSLADCGHFLPEEQPELLAEALRAFTGM